MAEKASVRRLIETADDIVTKGYDGTMDANQMLDYAESGIFEISQARQKGQYSHIRDVLVENLAIIDRAEQMDGGLTGITTGFSKLDEMTSGMQKSDLIILAARPAMGKTAFALSLARNAAVKGKASVMIFSLEMAKEQLNQRLGERSDTLRRRIALYIEKRIQYAYPAAARQEQTALRKGEKNFLSVSDLLWLFVIGAFLGDMVETVFCRVTAGVWMSRSSLVWGPFSVVWGLALVLATVLLRQEKDRSDRYLFAFGTVMGGVYEYVCSAVTELLFGTVFWDYSKFKFNLGGRINLLYCFFWGIAAVMWMRYGYPLVLKLMKKVRSHIRPWMTAALAVFMAVNMLTSALALARYDARTSGDAPNGQLEVFLDEHFDNARMEHIYPNAKKVTKAE